MLLNEMTWMEIRELLPQDPVVIQPVGSTEQHGPHLPLQTDILSAYEVARAAGERTGCLVAPPLPYGYSETWQTFPGTISFKPQTFMNCVSDIAESLVRGGFRKIFFLNGHNGNLAPLQTMMFQLLERYGREREVLIGAGSYFMIAQEACAAIGDSFSDGSHANEFETSMVMRMRPDLVHVDRLGDWVYEPELILSFREGMTSVHKLPDSSRHIGVFGDPRRANPDKGRRYFEACVARVAEVVENFDPKYFGLGDGS